MTSHQKKGVPNRSVCRENFRTCGKATDGYCHAIESNGEHAVFVSCDLAVVGRNLVEDVRVKLSGNSLGLEPKKIILNAIHTHTGLGYSTAKAKGGVIKYRQMLEEFLTPGQK